MAEPPVRLVDGTFTYEKDGKDKTFGFHANYIQDDDTILLEIQGCSPTVVGLAKDLLLAHVNKPFLGVCYMAIKLSRKEYINFIKEVLNKETQLSVKDKTGTYKPFPGKWSSEKGIKELPNSTSSSKPNSTCTIAGGRRRTRRRKHKRRSTRRRHHRR